MKLGLASAAALFATVAIAPAEAATVVHVESFSSPTGYKTGTIHNDGGIASNTSLKDLSVEVTDFDFHVTSPSVYDVFTYCIDIQDYLYVPGDFKVKTASEMGLSTAQSNAILSLLTNTLANPSSASLDQGANTAKAAGIQLAIWEIMNETGSAWDIANGSFSASGGTLGSLTTSGDALNFSRVFLTNVSTGGSWYNHPAAGYALSILSGADANPKDQNQVFLVAVPEPATWGMMVLGFGAIGGALRVRRRSALAQA